MPASHRLSVLRHRHSAIFPGASMQGRQSAPVRPMSSPPSVQYTGHTAWLLPHMASYPPPAAIKCHFCCLVWLMRDAFLYVALLAVSRPTHSGQTVWQILCQISAGSPPTYLSICCCACSRALAHYQLDGWVSEHVGIQLEVSNVYRCGVALQVVLSTYFALPQGNLWRMAGSFMPSCSAPFL